MLSQYSPLDVTCNLDIPQSDPYYEVMPWGKKLSVALCVGLLGLVTFLGGPADAQNSEAIKPFVLVIFDVSGSMGAATGQGSSSCGAADTRIDHAKCAIQQVVDAHSDIQFGMGRFRTTPDGASDCFLCEQNTAIDCVDCNEGNGSNCSAAMSSADRFQLLVPFVEDANDSIKEWVNFNCGASGCSLDPADSPEMRVPFGNSFTPLGGALRGARRFFQGNDTNINSNAVDNLDSIYGAGIDDPIGTDPLRDDFIAVGQQCRPYIVVLLTDGEETCEQFNATGGTVDVASDLLVTPFGGNNYRIETKPIGFGLSPGNAQIEAMARAGGNPGDGAIGDGNAAATGSHEGLYANTEQELINAFNQIISDSILVEICDGEDNDCDGQVDEGFQLFCDVDGGNPAQDLCDDPGDDCDGNDDNCTLGTADEIVNACGLCGPPPVEVCNLSDDDCDGIVDENGDGIEGSLCNGCIPVGQEICNNDDEDCDGNIDEGITQPCGTDVGECTAGVETCVAGDFINCTAIDGTNETCDGLDNDCNGVVDGFVEQCAEIPGNVDPFDGVCQPGFSVCEVPAIPGMGNSFGPCQGEIGPSDESCDLLDNDCDADVDEETGGADCSSTCGVGTTECVAGVLECNNGGMMGTDEICNGLDDDCDNVIDENVPDPIPNTCDEGGTLCLPGVLQCIGGDFVCTGGTAPGIEVCDCLDNDCDDAVDEEPPALCPTGSSCTDCQCAFPCQAGEFPCPQGFLCSADNFCLVDPCFNVDCTPTGEGNATTCVAGDCVEVCTVTSCSPGTACRPSDGTCQFDDCRGFPELCGDDEFCVIDQCVTDACTGVVCPGDDEYCLDGACVASCADVNCPDGQSCRLGVCEATPCGGACESGQVCSSDGVCQNNPCTAPCLEGQICNPADGECVQDPCLGVECPNDGVCDFGTCFDPSHGDAGPPVDNQYVSPGGGGGCSTGGGTGALSGLLLMLLLAWSRKREEGL